MANTYNLFISHSWTYSDAYDNLVKLLNARGYFSFNNCSVPKDDPIHNAPTSAALYQAIYNQMKPASVVLIMAGVYSTYSEWINKEIKIAKSEFSNSKPIIAIRPWAQTNMSSVVQDAADEIVGWNTESIVAAIRKWG
ncbi:TIR domain-containing protein [uncultured Rhodoferax sp.]|uniref:TIR domain-containing protein n=1 Tax=uncultured Rhodoferax sp. TaxID=223188 RepID=UPI0025DF4E3F|nr:TIR domain-containing protein [uncultured Rhodoferax sp.]